MAGRGKTTFKKRQKEQKRLERREQKAAKKLERKAVKDDSPVETADQVETADRSQMPASDPDRSDVAEILRDE